MFIIALVFSVLIGFLLGGSFKNLSNIKLKGTFIIITAFIIEFSINILIQKEILTVNSITYLLEIIMYSLLLIFTVVNRRSHFILVMGLGFLLNSLAILFNGGTMPVSQKAIEVTKITSNVYQEGLYSLVNSQTNFKFLCDIIPITFIRSFVISIGDIVLCIGMMLFIITAMKSNKKAMN